MNRTKRFYYTIDGRPSKELFESEEAAADRAFDVVIESKPSPFPVNIRTFEKDEDGTGTMLYSYFTGN